MLLKLKNDKKEDEEREGKTEKKDLSQNENKERKKRKETKKPWGKKDRLIVFLLILVTVGSSVILAMSARGWKLPGIKRINLPKISLLKEKTIVIEGDDPLSEGSMMVLSDFEDITNKLSGIYGLYIVDLESNENYGIYKYEGFGAASLVKLPVMAAMLQEAEYGNLDLSEEYELKSSDKTPGSGSLYDKPDGHVVTYEELVKLMGQESDNTAYVIAKNIVGEEKIEKVQEQFGMNKTSIKDNTTTPADIASYFEKLYKNEVLTGPNSDKILDYLTDTKYEDWLSAGIPDDVRVSHKYGREVHIVNDAGVVYADKPYIVVILSKGVIEKEADENLSELSKSVYENIQSH